MTEKPRRDRHHEHHGHHLHHRHHRRHHHEHSHGRGHCQMNLEYHPGGQKHEGHHHHHHHHHHGRWHRRSCLHHRGCPPSSSSYSSLSSGMESQLQNLDAVQPRRLPRLFYRMQKQLKMIHMFFQFLPHGTLCYAPLKS